MSEYIRDFCGFFSWENPDSGSQNITKNTDIFSLGRSRTHTSNYLLDEACIIYEIAETGFSKVFGYTAKTQMEMYWNGLFNIK